MTLEEEPDKDQEIPTPLFSRTETSSVDSEDFERHQRGGEQLNHLPA